jgi:hypothetical protein
MRYLLSVYYDYILYMFPSLICSSSGSTVYTSIGIFCAYYVGWLLAGLEYKMYQLLYYIVTPDDEQISARNM